MRRQTHTPNCCRWWSVCMPCWRVDHLFKSHVAEGWLEGIACDNRHVSDSQGCRFEMKCRPFGAWNYKGRVTPPLRFNKLTAGGRGYHLQALWASCLRAEFLLSKLTSEAFSRRSINTPRMSRQRQDRFGFHSHTWKRKTFLLPHTRHKHEAQRACR